MHIQSEIELPLCYYPLALLVIYAPPGVPSTVYSYYNTFGIVDGGNYGDKSGCWSYQLAPCAHHVNSSKYPACPDEVKTPACARKCTDDGKGWEASKHRGGKGYSVCQQGMNSKCSDAMAQDIYQNGM